MLLLPMLLLMPGMMMVVVTVRLKDDDCQCRCSTGEVSLSGKVCDEKEDFSREAMLLMIMLN